MCIKIVLKKVSYRLSSLCMILSPTALVMGPYYSMVRISRNQITRQVPLNEIIFNVIMERCLLPDTSSIL